MRIALLVIAGAIVVAACPIAHADDLKAAKIAFEKGTALFHDGKFDEAALAFREANRLRPNWKILYNIGQSEAAAKRHGLALQAFEEYLAEGGDEVPSSRRSEVADEIERLKGIVGEILLRAPGGALVFVDDRARGTAPLPGPMPVAAGKLHVLRVELEGVVLLKREIRVGSGRIVEVDVTPREDGEPGPAPVAEDAAAGEDASTPSPAAPPPMRLAPDGLAVGGWVLAGVGAAALIASAVTGGMALNLDEELAADCPDQECGPERHDDVDRLRALSVSSDVLTGVGAAALAAGATMVVVSVVRDQREADTAPIALVPTIDAARFGLALEGRF